MGEYEKTQGQQPGQNQNDKSAFGQFDGDQGQGKQSEQGQGKQPEQGQGQDWQQDKGTSELTGAGAGAQATGQQAQGGQQFGEGKPGETGQGQSGSGQERGQADQEFDRKRSDDQSKG